jgi:linoleoyl-CoA desaturase
MVFKSIIVGALFVASYLLIYWSALPLWAVLSLYGLNGFCAAMIGFNISHDAVHGSYTSNKTINGLLGATFNLLGTSDYVWKIKHNVVHHTYTNIPDHDSDVDEVQSGRAFETNSQIPAHHHVVHVSIYFYYLGI